MKCIDEIEQKCTLSKLIQILEKITIALGFGLIANITFSKGVETMSYKNTEYSKYL